MEANITATELNQAPEIKESPKLEPCPHCGGMASVVEWEDGFLFKTTKHSVECDVCQSSTRIGELNSVIGIWNMRR